MVKIKEVDYCYAEYGEGIIKIHEMLFYYNIDLYNHAIEHEKGHIGNTFIEDLKHDIDDFKNWRMHIKSIPFMFKHPKIILKNLLPIWYFRKKKYWEYCPVQIVQYITYLMIGLGIYVLLVY